MTPDPAISSSADLRQLLYERSQRFRNVIPVCRGPATGEKWVLASGLQKAIRRGNVGIAALCAETLLAVDPGYLWRRLPVIALEDVFGDKVLCALTIEAGRSSVFRRRIGERQVLHYLVHALCSAVKDRSLTDLLMLADDPPPRARDWYTHVDKLGMSYIDSYLARYGLTCAGLGAMVPKLIQMMPAKVTVITNPPDPYGDELIAGLPAATLDKHTSQGKRSYSYFAKSCKPVREFFARNPGLDPVKSIGITMFILESAHLDRHLSWAGRNELLGKSIQRDFTVYGLTIEQGKGLQLIAQDNRAKLNDCRRRILRSD